MWLATIFSSGTTFAAEIGYNMVEQKLDVTTSALSGDPLI